MYTSCVTRMFSMTFLNVNKKFQNLLKTIVCFWLKSIQQIISSKEHFIESLILFESVVQDTKVKIIDNVEQSANSREFSLT